MSYPRNVDWNVKPDFDGQYAWAAAQLAVLMDVRAELQKLNSLLHCDNAVAIPRILRDIRRRLPQPKAKRGTKGNQK